MLVRELIDILSKAPPGSVVVTRDLNSLVPHSIVSVMLNVFIPPFHRENTTEGVGLVTKAYNTGWELRKEL